MNLIVVVLLTFAVLGVVLLPIAGLAGRGRRRLRRSAAESMLALAPEVDESVRDLAEAGARWVNAIERALQLVPSVRETLPMLRVMGSARSSPRVYPSNWIGDLCDALDGALTEVEARGSDWRSAWLESPQRTRARVSERAAEHVEGVHGALEHGALSVDRVQTAAFSYIEADELGRVEAALTELAENLGRVGRGMENLRHDPYR